MIFSLIVATFGRKEELGELMRSLACQTIGPENFEIIVVDQNTDIELGNIIAQYSIALNIKHILSPKKGLSYNRNIGLSKAIGEYICFPDDDCTYYPDTLSNAYSKLKDSDTKCVFGAIRDRDTGENIIRDWPYKNIKLTRFNFFKLYSSITIFCRKNEILFNESLGVGSRFGSYEDADYSYKILNHFKKCYYYSDIEVWHPKSGIHEFSKEKNYSYGLGFGAFCASHKRDIYILRILMLSLSYHLCLAIYSFLRADYKLAEKRLDSLSSRLKGFLYY